MNHASIARQIAYALGWGLALAGVGLGMAFLLMSVPLN